MNAPRILVVEDENIVALDIQERLSSLGYALAGCVRSGEQALELAAQQRPSLVLMDIRLQGEMDGIAAAQEMRDRWQLPVVFLTAHSEDSTLDRAKRTEPFGYILKPFDDRELKSTIEMALYRHHSEVEIRRLNRLYAVLSQVNQAIVRCRTRDELLPLVCQSVVEYGVLGLAWIGWLDRATGRIEPAYQFGSEDSHLGSADFFACDDLARGGGPGQAVLTGEPYVCNGCGRDTCPYPAEHSPARFGFQSCGSFPLRLEDQVCGVLNVSVAEADFFAEREIDLFKEVAMDISFALDKIDSEACRQRAEAEIRQLNMDLERRVRERTAELEHANRELDAFSYSVSHDLRAPLRAVDGFAGILASEYRDRLDDEGRRVLGVVQSQVRHMGRLIDDLLRFARMGRYVLQKTNLEMDQIVAEAVEQLREANSSREVDFRVDSLPPAHADASLMRQVWLNLLSNALKFSQSRKPRLIEVGGAIQDDDAVYFVRDNGVGFDMKYADKLFKVFQRLHSPDEFEGTGVGLSLVQRIVHRHGGRVWAEAELDRGATFYFSLPHP
jgi:signal transduction histidine kinase/AmiR/NasT family two-component response regulator